MRTDGSITGGEDYDGIVCPVCFAFLAKERGVVTGMWRMDAVEVTSALETETPSGRVWDSKTWLWEYPEVTA